MAAKCYQCVHLWRRLSWYALCQRRNEIIRGTLEDLYYGNITPCDKRIRSDSPLQRVLDEAEQRAEQLAAKLDAEGKALLHRMAYAENEASSTIALENFILGFRLGMRLAVEGLLDSDDSCLADIYGES